MVITDEQLFDSLLTDGCTILDLQRITENMVDGTCHIKYEVYLCFDYADIFSKEYTTVSFEKGICIFRQSEDGNNWFRDDVITEVEKTMSVDDMKLDPKIKNAWLNYMLSALDPETAEIYLEETNDDASVALQEACRKLVSS